MSWLDDHIHGKAIPVAPSSVNGLIPLLFNTKTVTYFLFLPPRIFSIIEKNIASVQLATFHTRITGSVLNLATAAIHFVWATPGTNHIASFRFTSSE